LAADPVPLGAPLGIRLGEPLGGVLGDVLGSVLPIAGGGLLTVAAVSLVIGMRVVRRKRDRQAASLSANGVKE
jgi:predicted MFS family arabinose efflux permease